MTSRYWTPEIKRHYKELAEKQEHERSYMRNYMKRARAEGKVKHWRQYLKEKLIREAITNNDKIKKEIQT